MATRKRKPKKEDDGFFVEKTGAKILVGNIIIYKTKIDGRYVAQIDVRKGADAILEEE